MLTMFPPRLFLAPMLLLPAILLAGCDAGARTPNQASEAARNADRLSQALAGLTPGKPQLCIFQNRQHFQTIAIGDTLLYKANSKLVYRNDTTGGCDRAAHGDAIVTRNVDSQLCSGQIVTTVDFVIGRETGSCSLKQFVPYRAK